MNCSQLSLFFALVACCCCLATQAQVAFIPQSNLGRLVQTLASPLVMASQAAAGYPSTDEESESLSQQQPLSRPSGYESSGYQQQPSLQQQQHQALQYEPSRQPVMLQQAPSHQRGYPQRFRPPQNNKQQNNDDDESDSAGPSDYERHEGGARAAPSNKQDQREYQMGAYLGPSMDDKEINNAFNSNDEGPADEPAAGGAHDQAATNYNHNGGPSGYESSNGFVGSGYAPGGGHSTSASGRSPTKNTYADSSDDDGADEDDAVPARRGAARGGLNLAATQNRNQRQQQQQQMQYNQQMMAAAANGNSPYGGYVASGPADLSGLMSALGPNQMYQGDGSYPGQSYYNQQGPQRAQQAASNSLGGFGAPGGYGEGQQEAGQQEALGKKRARDNYDNDGDMDGDDD